MSTLTFTTTCDVCGGEGAASLRTSAAAWNPRETVTHRDPRVCRDVLSRKRDHA